MRRASAASLTRRMVRPCPLGGASVSFNGGEQQAAFFQTDHVVEMGGEQRPQLFRRNQRFRDQHVKLFAQHFLDELGRARVLVHDHPLRD
jgi:hypothetical protein